MRPPVEWEQRKGGRWRVPDNDEVTSLIEHWHDAPGTAVMCTSWKFREWLQFWCIGQDGDKWWANRDYTATIYWFESEQEAKDFVEVMIRMN